MTSICEHDGNPFLGVEACYEALGFAMAPLPVVRGVGSSQAQAKAEAEVGGPFKRCSAAGSCAGRPALRSAVQTTSC